MLGAEYRVLGPLEVRFDGEPIAVPAGKGRVLLATLLLRPNQFVSVDELVERLWEGAPSSIDRAAKTLQMTVARLRQSLGPANCVVTTTNGYLAQVENLDLLRFRALADQPHAALALWRGAPLSNVKSDSLHREEVPRLVEEQLSVLEDRIDNDLADGRAEGLVVELRALTASHPLRERFWAQLMVALYRSGRQAGALDAFHQVRELLANELGIDPGVALRDLHQSILRADPELRPHRNTIVPRQLPPDLASFTGRGDDLAQLDRLLPRGAAGRAVVISAIAGSAGVGKSTLAVRWAHQVRDRFPDGQLAVNLRGYDREEPLAPHDALGQLLRGLGHPVKEIPDHTDQRIGLYRSLLADRRVLVLLDNARTADQVRPLLPASGQSIVVITSRSDLRGLVALNDAKVLELGVLPLAEAMRLLEKVVGADRTDAELGATAELARLCACLPLALRIAASLLVSEPHLRVRDLVDKLSTGDRLAELEIGDDGEAAVRAAFDLSYTALTPEQRRMFRALGLAPRAEFTPMSAGALARVPSSEALKTLRLLARAHLVEEHAPQRFSQHDLLWLHARERAAAEEPAEERRAAVERFLDHHLHSADSAESLLLDSRAEKPLTEHDPVVEVVEFRDKNAAVEWSRRDYDLLIETCEFALANGHFEHAWKLPYSLIGHVTLFGSNDDRLRIFGIALQAAQRLGDRHAKAVALHLIGIAHKNRHQFDEAQRALREALLIRREIGYTRGVAITEAELASTFLWLGDHDQALTHYRESIEQWRLTGHARGWATSMNSLAYTLVRKGDFSEAIEVVTEALDILGDASPFTMDTLAQAHAGLGDLARAVRIYGGIFASGSLDTLGARPRAEILFHGSQILARAGDRETALTHAREALTRAESSALAMAATIRRFVRELEETRGSGTTG
ncbi:BTAD domain-containing putative transcriptional regulator [Lentzea sp. NPDC059081]|uniref:AfsR/SARP family transcriptional regulator n=1 Tax=Lentzea sp. NPDC059081 TaxID=3346719 RepID=UPI00369DAAF6